MKSSYLKEELIKFKKIIDSEEAKEGQKCVNCDFLLCSNEEEFIAYKEKSEQLNKCVSEEKGAILNLWFWKLWISLLFELNRESEIKSILINSGSKGEEYDVKKNRASNELLEEKRRLSDSIGFKEKILKENIDSLLKKNVLLMKMRNRSLCLGCQLKSTENSACFGNSNNNIRDNIINSDFILFAINKDLIIQVNKIINFLEVGEIFQIEEVEKFKRIKTINIEGIIEQAVKEQRNQIELIEQLN